MNDRVRKLATWFRVLHDPEQIEFIDAELRKTIEEEQEAIIYNLEEAKGYTVEFNKHMDYVIDLIRARRTK